MRFALKSLLVVVVLATTFSVQGQDEDNPWVISVGVNAIDTYPTNNSAEDLSGKQSGWFNNFYNFGHWNTITSFTSFGVSRNLTESYSAYGRFNINSITAFGDREVSSQIYKSIDLGMRNSLAKKGASWDPFYEIGLGYAWLGDNEFLNLNAGLGLAYWFNDNIGMSYQANLKKASNNVGVDHFQHTFGVNVKFGGIDTDGDGVYDKNDACPEEPGLEEFNGCPDTDGDGITDRDDACPDKAGTIDMNGCPDTDGDGLSDIEDTCPKRPGSKEMRGCPDSDGDGINDKDDGCPEVVGSTQNNGCPWPDADADGVADKDDACPNLAGVPENNGCPKLPQDVLSTLNTEGSMIRFKAESAEISGVESAAVLQNIKQILISYPTVDFVVEGHASSDGSKQFNQKLSEARASAVKEALISSGVEENRLSTVAYGEDRPIGDNNTARGRKMNRRVQFSVGVQ